MSDNQSGSYPPRPERRDFQRLCAEAIAELGISPADAALFNVLHYGLTVPPSDLASRAASPDYSFCGTVSVPEVRAALKTALAKSWLQQVDETALQQMTDEVHNRGTLGPVYGYPKLGGVDFTPKGAELWLDLYRRCFRDRIANCDYTDTVHIKSTQFFVTEKAAQVEMSVAGSVGVATVKEGPFSTGPWRIQWWRLFPQGYRVEIDERMKWEGRAGGYGGVQFWLRPPSKPDTSRHQQILDLHNVSLAEWLIFAELDNSYPHHADCLLATSASGTANRKFGVSVSFDECMAAFTACLRNGWITYSSAVDHGDDHVSVARDIPLFVPQIPEQVSVIDFTESGAALYRAIAAELYGPSWEGDLRVEKTYYREEHRYSCSEETLRRVRPEYTDAGDVIRAERLVPIGPWCVYWWEQFLAGYRLELEIETP